MNDRVYQCKYVTYHVCKDIVKMHGQSFIHCDLKPSNILYLKKGTLNANIWTNKASKVEAHIFSAVTLLKYVF